MSRVVKALLLCALIILAAPAPASAISWFWLDNFSGPGWFLGEELEARAICFGPTSNGATSAAASRSATSESSTHEAKAIAVFKYRCLKTIGDEARRRFSINPSIGYSIASNNSLIYRDNGVNRRVQLLRLGIAGAFVVPGLGRQDAVEVRAGVESNRLFGPAFETFNRGSFTVATDIKPFIWSKSDDEPRRWQDVVTIRVGAVHFFKGFDATDFGAVPGTFHSDPETLLSVQLVLDFGKAPQR